MVYDCFTHIIGKPMEVAIGNSWKLTGKSMEISVSMEDEWMIVGDSWMNNDG